MGMPSSARADDRRIAKILNVVSSYPARPWHIAELAAEVKLSPTHFRRLFLRDVGLSPRRFLREQRLRLAAHLLVSTDLTVKEISSRVWIGDVSHFSRDFAGRFGCAPGLYRETGRAVTP